MVDSDASGFEPDSDFDFDADHAVDVGAVVVGIGFGNDSGVDSVNDFGFAFDVNMH